MGHETMFTDTTVNRGTPRQKNKTKKNKNVKVSPPKKVLHKHTTKVSAHVPVQDFHWYFSKRSET